jgi:hypothetical protein
MLHPTSDLMPSCMPHIRHSTWCFCSIGHRREDRGVGDLRFVGDEKIIEATTNMTNGAEDPIGQNFHKNFCGQDEKLAKSRRSYADVVKSEKATKGHFLA